PDTVVELGEARARPAETDGIVIDRHELLLEVGVLRFQFAADDVLRVIGPVAVGADPDLEQRRLTLDDRAVRRRRERLYACAGPDQCEPECELDPAPPARPLTVDEALPGGRDLRLCEPDADPAAHVLGGGGRDLVREPDALDLLSGLECARLV